MPAANLLFSTALMTFCISAVVNTKPVVKSDITEYIGAATPPAADCKSAPPAAFKITPIAIPGSPAVYVVNPVVVLAAQEYARTPALPVAKMPPVVGDTEKAWAPRTNTESGDMVLAASVESLRRT